MMKRARYYVAISWNEWGISRYTSKRKALAAARELLAQGYIGCWVKVCRMIDENAWPEEIFFRVIK